MTLMFDAMHIQSNFSYVHTSDEIVGVVNIDTEDRRDEPAKLMLVFMIRSIFGGWCQVVGHHFIGTKFTKDDLSSLLMMYFKALHSADLQCKAVICDQEPSHMSLFKLLGVTEDTPFIKCPASNQRVYAFLDPPHLLKSTRNNLLQYDFLVSE